MYASCFVYCAHSQSPHSEQHMAVLLLSLHFKDNTVCVIEHISFNSAIMLCTVFIYGWQNACVAKIRMSEISVMMYAIPKLDTIV